MRLRGRRGRHVEKFQGARSLGRRLLLEGYIEPGKGATRCGLRLRSAALQRRDLPGTGASRRALYLARLPDDRRAVERAAQDLLNVAQAERTETYAHLRIMPRVRTLR